MMNKKNAGMLLRNRVTVTVNISVLYLSWVFGAGDKIMFQNRVVLDFLSALLCHIKCGCKRHGYKPEKDHHMHYKRAHCDTFF